MYSKPLSNPKPLMTLMTLDTHDTPYLTKGPVPIVSEQS